MKCSFYSQRYSFRQVEGEESQTQEGEVVEAPRSLGVAVEQNLETDLHPAAPVVAFAELPAGSIDNMRHSSDIHHRRHMDPIRNTEHIERYSQ